MAANRLGRINEEIQRALSESIRSLKDPRIRGMISVTRVETTSDLRYARVWVSVLDKTTQKDVISGLRSASGYLRRELGSSLTLRYTPELDIRPDDSIETGDRILGLLSELETEEAPS